MLVTRVEEWCVEAMSTEEARQLLDSEAGYRTTPPLSCRNFLVGLGYRGTGRKQRAASIGAALLQSLNRRWRRIGSKIFGEIDPQKAAPTLGGSRPGGTQGRRQPRPTTIGANQQRGQGRGQHTAEMR